MTILAQNSALFDHPHATQQSTSLSTTTYQSIAALNIQPGNDGDLLATCDVKIGGVLVRGVRVRRGRQGTTYVNLPSTHVGGGWVDLVEITSRPLEEAVRQVVLAAVMEATR